MVIAQGRKQAKLGRNTFIYDPSRFLLTSIDLPVVSRVVEATEETPCLVLLLKLEMATIRELLSLEEIRVAPAPSDAPAMATGEATPEFLDACCRLVALLETPRDIPFLSGLIKREIVYRVLQGSAGARLRAIATLGDHHQRTAKAIAWIKANYAKPIRVEDLAQIAGMSVSTFHHYFRVLTAMSPLQYQKRLRLQAARGRMLLDGLVRQVRPLKWDTKAPASSIANTAVSLDSPQSGMFGRSARRVLWWWSRLALAKTTWLSTHV